MSTNKNTKKSSNQNRDSILIVLWIIILWVVIGILLFSQDNSRSGVSNLSNNNSTSNGNDNKDLTDSIQNNSWTENKWDPNTVWAGDTIKVDYVGKLEDGTIFDSSLEEFAKKMKNYDPKVTKKYEPLGFTVGWWQMIKGFDAWVVGMKLWEKKTLKIEAKDAYGEKTTSQPVPKKYFQDKIEEKVPAKNFQDKIIQNVPKATLWEKWKSLKVWEVINSEWISWTIKEIKENDVVIEIDNKQNIFYWKTLKVGLSADFQWNKITIKALDKENVTIEIDNKSNPFYWKKLVEWLVWKAPDWSEIKIKKIDWDNVEIEVPNAHELAGKNLIFDVEIKEIKKK